MSAFVTRLVLREAEALSGGGVQRIVVGGLSQGCAAALHVLFNFGGVVEGGDEAGAAPALGGFIGMSGWLPFAETLDPLVAMNDKREDLENNSEVIRRAPPS